MTTFLVRTHVLARAPRVHIIEQGRPLCGGGHGGKAIQWQHDIGPSNCRACAAIALRRSLITHNPQPTAFTPPRS